MWIYGHYKHRNYVTLQFILINHINLLLYKIKFYLINLIFRLIVVIQSIFKKYPRFFIKIKMKIFF